MVRKAGKGIYAQLLDRQLPLSARILDAGCGTGQLVNFLGTANRTVVGIDLSFNSLRKGADFRRQFDLPGGRFVEMDIFRLGLREESFDYVFSNGVLHHTADAALGFGHLCRLVKKGGYIVVGLYNSYGRTMLFVRKWIFRLTGGRFTWLDYFMRQRAIAANKRHIWFMDQYRNPHEDTYTVDDVLGWFRANGIVYVNSVPKITLAETLTADEKLFERHAPGSRLDHVLAQLGWMFTEGREGGFFIIIGQRA